MNLQELIDKLRKIAEKIDVSAEGFLAVQVNIKDADPGVFYVEVKDHKINIEPYEYNDRDCLVTISMSNFNKLIDGSLDPVAAYTLGKIKVEGDIGKALEFVKLIKRK